MKKLALLILLALPMIGSAQTDQKNSVKMKFSGATIMANNLAFSYERKLSDAFSVNLGLNYTSKKVLPLKNIANNVLGPVLDSAGVNSDILNTKVSSWGVGLQFKYFFKKKALRGLYLAPYFGYQAGGMKPFLFNFPDITNPNINHEGSVTAKFSFIGGGVGIGNQWVLNNGLTFDILWLGIGAGGNTIRLNGEDDSGDVNYEFVNDMLVDFLAKDESDLSKYGVNVTSSYTDSGIEIVGKHVFPYMKVLNISVGFSF